MQRTEMRNPKTMHIDKETTENIIRIIQEENINAVKAIEEAFGDIEKATDAIAETVKSGGRVFYIGAGTSGRMGVLDAVECVPTFGVSSDLFNGILAGGIACMCKSSEDAEDNKEASLADLEAHGFSAADILIGISASGTAAYVISAVEYARSIGAKTVSVVNNKDTLLGKSAHINICADTGPEVISGSTRMKAGTAQKIILNMLSTASMIKCGHVYENLMINLRPVNKKLIKRMIGIVVAILGCNETEAQALLEAHDWSIRSVVDSHAQNA